MKTSYPLFLYKDGEEVHENKIGFVEVQDNTFITSIGLFYPLDFSMKKDFLLITGKNRFFLEVKNEDEDYE